MVLLVLLIVQNVGFVSEQTVYIIEQFGKYLTTWNAGLHVKIPVIQAEKERTLRLAEAKAQAIKIVNDAHADAIRVMREASTEEAYLTIKKLETLNSVADGNATKLFIPTDLASTAGVLGSLVESVKDKR